MTQPVPAARVARLAADIAPLALTPTERRMELFRLSDCVSLFDRLVTKVPRGTGAHDAALSVRDKLGAQSAGAAHGHCTMMSARKRKNLTLVGSLMRLAGLVGGLVLETVY